MLQVFRSTASHETSDDRWIHDQPFNSSCGACVCCNFLFSISFKPYLNHLIYRILFLFFSLRFSIFNYSRCYVNGSRLWKPMYIYSELKIRPFEYPVAYKINEMKWNVSMHWSINIRLRSCPCNSCCCCYCCCVRCERAISAIARLVHDLCTTCARRWSKGHMTAMATDNTET